jgi:hypothetical protein
MYFSESWKILLQTSPYLVFRIMVYLGLGIGVGIYLGFVFFLTKLFGAGGWLFLIGLAILWGLLRLLRNYVLYMIQAGHIAVITELVQKGELPPGVHQVRHGKETVTRLFKETSVLFVVDQLVQGIIRAVNRTLVNFTQIIPIPGLENLARLASTIFNFSVTYVDEAIFSYNLARPGEDIWVSAKRGVILYVQNWKPILKTAVGLAAINLLAFFVFFLVLLIPFGPLAALAQGEGWKFFWLALTVVLAYSFKLALVNPFSMVSMIITFNRAVAGQEPNLEWEEKLEQVSGKFRQLKEKAGFSA